MVFLVRKLLSRFRNYTSPTHTLFDRKVMTLSSRLQTLKNVWANAQGIRDVGNRELCEICDFDIYPDNWRAPLLIKCNDIMCPNHGSSIPIDHEFWTRKLYFCGCIVGRKQDIAVLLWGNLKICILSLVKEKIHFLRQEDNQFSPKKIQSWSWTLDRQLQ